MSEADFTVEWMFVWHSVWDSHRCDVCENLTAYVWEGIGEPPFYLRHPHWGEVWDVQNRRSLTHKHCRCGVRIFARFQIGQALAKFKDLHRGLGGDEFAGELDKLLAEGQWIEVSSIEEYRHAVKNIRADVGQIRDDMREIEYIMYRAGSGIRRVLPEPWKGYMGTGIDALISGRMAQTSWMQMGTGTGFGLAMGATTLALLGISAYTQFYQWSWQQITEGREAIAREQATQLQAMQIELRRKRW